MPRSARSGNSESIIARKGFDSIQTTAGDTLSTPTSELPSTKSHSSKGTRKVKKPTAEEDSDDDNDVASVFGAAITSNSPMMNNSLTPNANSPNTPSLSHIGALRSSKSFVTGSTIAGSLSARAALSRDAIVRSAITGGNAASGATVSPASNCN